MGAGGWREDPTDSTGIYGAAAFSGGETGAYLGIISLSVLGAESFKCP